jgi:hypothetical protein
VATHLEGTRELERKLRELADPRKQLNVLRASVRNPMNKTDKVARSNIAKISPGKTLFHKTYKGRIVGAGFASRNVKVVVKTSKDKQSVSALLGVAPEAYYALQFFELGTAFIPKQPWLMPAFESQKDEMLKGVAATLRKRIETIAKSQGPKG